MHDTSLVGGTHGVRQNQHQASGLLWLHLPVFQGVVKVSASAKLQSKEGQAVFIGSVVVDLNNIGMLNPTQHLGFCSEASECRLQPVGVAVTFVEDFFQRDNAADRLLPGKVNNAHTAFAQLLDDFIILIKRLGSHTGGCLGYRHIQRMLKSWFMVACLTHVRRQIGLFGDLVGLIVGVSVCRFLLLHCFRIVCGSIIYRWLLDDFLRVGSGMRDGRCRERMKR